MRDDKSGTLESKEFQILKALKLVLTDVVKDTATQPGLKHPLSDRTIEGIRQCLIIWLGEVGVRYKEKDQMISSLAG